jgi:hypothetical protein
MTYIPTTAELEEMGFQKSADFDRLFFIDVVPYKQLWFSLRTNESWIWDVFFIPQSRQDIETLIRLFTKP